MGLLSDLDNRDVEMLSNIRRENDRMLYELDRREQLRRDEARREAWRSKTFERTYDPPDLEETASKEFVRTVNYTKLPAVFGAIAHPTVWQCGIAGFVFACGSSINWFPPIIYIVLFSISIGAFIIFFAISIATCSQMSDTKFYKSILPEFRKLHFDKVSYIAATDKALVVVYTDKKQYFTYEKYDFPDLPWNKGAVLLKVLIRDLGIRSSFKIEARAEKVNKTPPIKSYFSVKLARTNQTISACAIALNIKKINRDYKVAQQNERLAAKNNKRKIRKGESW